MINKNNWRDRLMDIAKLRQDIRQNAPIMTQYEKLEFDKAFNRRREKERQDITEGALSELSVINDAFLKEQGEAELNALLSIREEIRMASIVMDEIDPDNPSYVTPLAIAVKSIIKP